MYDNKHFSEQQKDVEFRFAGDSTYLKLLFLILKCKKKSSRRKTGWFWVFRLFLRKDKKKIITFSFYILRI